MGGSDFDSGKWVLYIILYYIVLFLVVSASSLLGTSFYQKTPTVTYNDPGFQEQQNFLTSNSGLCSGKTKTNIFGDIACVQFSFTENDCNNVSSCYWVAEYNLFNISLSNADCYGTVNITALGINESEISVRKGFCPALLNVTYCEKFGCNWINYTESVTDVSLFGSGGGISSIWDSIVFIIKFKADLGLGNYNWLVILIFFYLPIIALIWAIYRATPIPFK